MPRIRNVSPLGALDVPLLGRTLAASEEADVPKSAAEQLLAQPDNFQPVATPTPKESR
ncbi:MAG: hypothetical protein QG597_2069 [Actinomycetota bacterium]|nr:hypothetical protein [Actinomycetota bacterium]